MKGQDFRMSDYINYTSWKGLKALIAQLCDKDKNGKLEKAEKYDEVSIFNNKYAKMLEIEREIKEEFSVAKQDAIENFKQKMFEPVKKYTKPAPAKRIMSSADMISEEAQKHGVKADNVDIEYWAEKIDSAAQKYNVPKELLVGIIGQETNGKFSKNINASTGAGPMQITKITIQDFFPKEKGSWNSVYKKMNEELLNDILYQKDDSGNFVKDANGNLKLRFSSSKALRDACAQDDELGIKVGIICFEMKYVKAVAKEIYGKATYTNIPKVIEELKNGSITLSAKQNEKIVEEALKNYNSVFKSYAPAVVDSLKRSGMDFNELDLIR